MPLNIIYDGKSYRNWVDITHDQAYAPPTWLFTPRIDINSQLSVLFIVKD
jgi:hypothetical protein